MSALPTHALPVTAASPPESTGGPLKLLASLAVVAVLAVLIIWRWDRVSQIFAPPEPKPVVEKAEVVSVPSPGLVAVDPESPFRKNHLSIASAAREEVQHPVLAVTGSVMARLAVGKDQAESRWDFSSPEVASAYGDWLKARADVAFNEKQTAKVRELAEARIAFLKTVAQRLEKLVGVGAESERDLASARSERLQAEIQGQKDIFEAETNLKAAVRTRGLLERQLLSAGIDPDKVSAGTEGLVLVVADVPENKVSKVHVGQQCEAKFFSFPGETFRGKMGRIGPSVSREKRTLRVTFELHDPYQKLLPGMFADIGLGTEARSLVTIPAEAVLHSGRNDYVLKEEGNVFRVVEVHVEEPLPPKPQTNGEAGSRLPVASGLAEGDRVVSRGAILLKPAMAKALQPSNGQH